MKILAVIYKTGGINCQEVRCPFKHTCANHRTAGDFRAEGGFSPELFEENGKVFCATRTQKTVEVCGETMPENYKSLNQGMIYLDKEGNFKIYSIYED